MRGLRSFKFSSWNLKLTREQRGDDLSEEENSKNPESISTNPAGYRAQMEGI